MSRPDGLIELPNGSHIYFDDASHAYYRARYDGESFVRSTRLTGASTLSKPLSWDSGRLLSWKERVTCEGVAELFNRESDLLTRTSDDFGWLGSGDGIRAKLKEASLLADDARDRKATIGTNVHAVGEALAAGEPLPNLDEIPEEEAGYVRAYLRWWELRRPDVHESEAFIYNPPLGYAGRFDLRAILHKVEEPDPGIDPFFDDKLTLADYKTSGWIAPSMHAQLMLYELGAVACGIGGSDGQMILQLRPDGSFREVRGLATKEDAHACISVYRGAGRIEREAKAA
jgi:hypothetical protein